MLRHHLRPAFALVVLALALAAPSAHAARPLTTGFTDPVFSTNAGGQRPARMSDVAAVGGQIVRIDLSWWAVDAQAPAGDPTDPGNPAYDWSGVDASVRDASARGLAIMFNVFRAPPWAEGPGRPPGPEPGTWKPNAGAFGLFARAVARRYSGSYPDPLRPGHALPRVRLYGAWNEANIDRLIAPQWENGHPASPAIYRALVNGLYSGVKSVSASNLVIAGAMTPYGDPPGGARMAPALFAREFFCLNGGLAPTGCGDPPHFDVFDHHPYDIGGPARAALAPDDVSTPDMGKLTRIIRVAERTGNALPRHRKRLWVTEISWETNPPDPGGIPILQQARWVEYAFYSFWRVGVDTVLWYNTWDDPPGQLGYPFTYQSGIQFVNGSGYKPEATAFRFPFVFERVDKKRVRVWGKTPDRGAVLIQKLSGGWRTIAAVRPGSNRVFYTVIRDDGRNNLRAVSRRGAVSIDWRPSENLSTTDTNG